MSVTVKITIEWPDTKQVWWVDKEEADKIEDLLFQEGEPDV